MRLRKYLVMRFSASRQNALLPVHHLLNDYHWQAIDADHVLVVAHYPANSHPHLQSHPDILILPSLQASVTVHQHATGMNKTHLFEPLRKIGANESHTAFEIIDKAIDIFGPRFEPEI